jgi:hypothetical protein
MSRHALLALVLLVAAACGGRSTPPDAPPDTDTPAARAELTAAQCQAQGGRVVGDIGDGATQRPDFRCPDSDQPPLANVVSGPGQPMGIEGAVCCK